MDDVVAVVLNWCNAPDTLACIESLRADGLPYERIILVDNASPDGSGARLQAQLPQVRYIANGENSGYAGGNNVGVQHALRTDAHWILVLNNDTLVERGMLATLHATGAADPSCAAVAPKILRADEPARLWFDGGDFVPYGAIGRARREHEHDRLPEQRDPASCTFLTGCALLLRREAIARYETLFDPTYFAYVEDAELSRRLRRDGWRLLYEPRARLLHKVPPIGAEPPIWAIVRRDRNRRRLAATHFGLLERLQFACWFYPTRLVRIAQYLAKGDGPRARAVFDGTFRP